MYILGALFIYLRANLQTPEIGPESEIILDLVEVKDLKAPGSMIQGSLRALAKSVHIRGPNSDLSGPTFRLQGQNWP